MPSNDDESDAGEYDRKDGSVRLDNDPPTRGRGLKSLERETELEFQRLEARNTGGVEHQTAASRGQQNRERRASIRRRRRYQVNLGLVASFTTNVSAQGFCTEVMRALPPRAAVEGLLQVRGANLPFAGEIAWAAQGDWHINLHGRMGVRFTRIDPDLARLLDA
jgi:PilZ domain